MFVHPELDEVVDGVGLVLAVAPVVGLGLIVGLGPAVAPVVGLGLIVGLGPAVAPVVGLGLAAALDVLGEGDFLMRREANCIRC